MLCFLTQNQKNKLFWLEMILFLLKIKYNRKKQHKNVVKFKRKSSKDS